jgi:hypothetical protein
MYLGQPRRLVVAINVGSQNGNDSITLSSADGGEDPTSMGEISPAGA